METTETIHLSDEVLALARHLSAKHAAEARWRNAGDEEKKNQGLRLAKARKKARKLKKPKALKNIA